MSDTCADCKYHHCKNECLESYCAGKCIKHRTNKTC